MFRSNSQLIPSANCLKLMEVCILLLYQAGGNVLHPAPYINGFVESVQLHMFNWTMVSASRGPS